MAFLSVLLDAFENKVPLALPMISEMDQISRRYDPFPFEEIFSKDHIYAFCQRWGLMVVETAQDTTYRTSFEEYYWSTFRLFHDGLFNGEKRERDGFVLDAIRSLRPNISSSLFAKALKKELESIPHLAVAQFRIEKDWQQHAPLIVERLNTKEHVWLSHIGICQKIKASLPSLNNLYVLCDEQALLLPKEQIRQECLFETGIRIYFKSDFVSPNELALYGPLRLSLIDFEMAYQSPVFIGNTRSTFSNMVTIQHYAMFGVHPHSHFAYNAPGPLYLRKDKGLLHHIPDL